MSHLLSQRDNASPFTLVQDTLEQSAKPLISEYIRRANLSKCHTILLSFETVRPPKGVDTFIRCFELSPAEITKAVSTTITSASSKKRFLILIDSMTFLASLSMQAASGLNLTSYLSSLLLPPPRAQPVQVSLVAVYHTDVPVSTSAAPYAPTPLSTLMYLATTVITVHSLPILVAEKAAKDRSLPTPVFGLAQQIEGIVIGLKSASKMIKLTEKGIVLELEHRRKSGRGVLEWYFLPSSSSSSKTTPQTFREIVVLLDDHPLFRREMETPPVSDADLADMTFSLGLTDRQRQERKGVILPYMDAQESGVPNEGGRILYDMGVEDDFDDEEDEI